MFTVDFALNEDDQWILVARCVVGGHTTDLPLTGNVHGTYAEVEAEREELLEDRPMNMLPSRYEEILAKDVFANI